MENLSERVLVGYRFQALQRLDWVMAHCGPSCDACDWRADCDRTFDRFEEIGQEIRRRKGLEATV